ncbi:MAG TPA: CPBP family intramembrane glutamic endopeptidase [Steroidobacteraceae bacterium]|nr:CPBP family intramembrane glutamic endopeptidase [Steroidobacteraceae bacterium]
MPILARLRQWALSRILLEAAAIVVTVVVMSRVLDLFIPPAPSPWHAGLAMLRNLIVAGLALVVYRLMVRWLERRRAVELDLRKGSVQFPAGVAMGLALMAAVYGILWAANVASFAPGTGLSGLGAGLVAAFLAGVFEELLFRAVLFRIVEQACGTTIALVVSAAVFGLVHGLNPGATLFSEVAIAVEAGLLLATAYALTRNLWLAIGIHAGWNFAEGNLFGALVSGHRPSHTLIHSTLTGPVALTGGNFGPEASLVSIGVCGSAALVFGLLIARRSGWRPRIFQLSAVDSPSGQ